jgi:hypothetical protein
MFDTAKCLLSDVRIGCKIKIGKAIAILCYTIGILLMYHVVSITLVHVYTLGQKLLTSLRSLYLRTRSSYFYAVCGIWWEIVFTIYRHFENCFLWPHRSGSIVVVFVSQVSMCNSEFPFSHVLAQTAAWHLNQNRTQTCISLVFAVKESCIIFEQILTLEATFLRNRWTLYS